MLSKTSEFLRGLCRLHTKERWYKR